MSEDHEHIQVKGLPSNAYTELKPGEEYQPVMPANKIVPEVSYYSVLWGVLMAVLFSAAAAYLGLKIGQVFEAAIPIAIIAVGLSAAEKILPLRYSTPKRSRPLPRLWLLARAPMRSCSILSAKMFLCLTAKRIMQR